MTRNEILEAINQTIVTNDKQGITAASLNNILTEIVNATPETDGLADDVIVRNIKMPDENGNFTDEDLAYNIETYHLMTEGDHPLVFPYGGVQDGSTVVFELVGVTYRSIITITLQEDGTIYFDYPGIITQWTSPQLVCDDSTALGVVTLPQNYARYAIFDETPTESSFGTAPVKYALEEEGTIKIGFSSPCYDYMEVYKEPYVDEALPEVFLTSGCIELGIPNYSFSNYNAKIYASFEKGLLIGGKWTAYSDEKYYTPISIIKNTEDQTYEITIYRNGNFVVYSLNNEGATPIISS